MTPAAHTKPTLSQVVLLLIRHHNMSLDSPLNHAGETPFHLAKRLHGIRAQAFLEYVSSGAERSSSLPSAAPAGATSGAAAAAAGAASAVVTAGASEVVLSSSSASVMLPPLQSAAAADEGATPAFVFQM